MEADDKSTFSEHRQYLVSLAYGMTGSAADAEDLLLYIVVNPEKLQHLPMERTA
jgi:hypothetical protein